MRLIIHPLIWSLMAIILASGIARGASDQLVDDLSDGSGVFTVDSTADKILPVWYHVPADIDAETAPIVFIMHGTNRDADRYRNEWAPLADEFGFVVIAPEFSRELWPGSRGYNLGNVMGSEGVNPKADWAYSQIEPLFDIVVGRLNSKRTSYGIYGHSAGSQFVHRFLYHIPDHRADLLITANAGWYTLPDFTSQWPYGLGSSVVRGSNLIAAFEAPLLVLLGDEDNDPDHSSLRRSPEAMSQGPHRFARGQYFYQAGKATAEARGLGFGWTLQFVPGARHSNAQMAEAAAPLLAPRQSED